MFIIYPQISNNILNNTGYNNVLEDIDHTIACLTKQQYLNDAYGFTGTVDMRFYKRLCEYREILLDRLLGCNCLDEEYTLYIISKIQKLIN